MIFKQQQSLLKKKYLTRNEVGRNLIACFLENLFQESSELTLAMRV